MHFVDEPSAVEARFAGDGSIRILSFSWSGQRLAVTDQGRTWTEADGRHFLVMAAGNRVFELRFDPAAGAWRIVRAPEATGLA